MQAVKGNREYNISEKEKENYLKEGYDIYENGERIETGKGKTVPYEEHAATLKELNDLKKEHAATLKELDDLKNKPKTTKKVETKEGE